MENYYPLWKAELIHSVITPMVLCWLLVYQMPVDTLIKIDGLCADFFGAGKTYKVAWSKLCRPKTKGGIGFKNFVNLRTTACLKLIW